MSEPAQDDKLTVAQRARVVERIKEIGALLPCPRCGHTEFNLQEALILHMAYGAGPAAIRLQGRFVPTACVVCKKCGFLSQHALGALGLMQEFGFADEPPDE